MCGSGGGAPRTRGAEGVPVTPEERTAVPPAAVGLAERTAGALDRLGLPWRRDGLRFRVPGRPGVAPGPLDQALRAIELYPVPGGHAWLGLDEPSAQWVRLDLDAPTGRARGRARGLSVALVGPDGAGKTTLADGLRAALPVPTAYVYLGVWREYPWDRWLRFVPGARLALRLLRLTLRSGQAAWHRRRGRLVLLDRFTSDVQLPDHELDRRGRLTAALVGRIGTRPDLLLVLDAPAEVMFARKGEQTLDELARRRLTYRQLAAGHPDGVVLDATRPVEQVRRDALRAVWVRLRRRWDG
jgi:thymidylate kinase